MLPSALLEQLRFESSSKQCTVIIIKYYTFIDGWFALNSVYKYWVEHIGRVQKLTT